MQNNTEYKTPGSHEREPQHFLLVHRPNNHNNQEAVKKKSSYFRSSYFKTRQIIILMAVMAQI